MAKTRKAPLHQRRKQLHCRICEDDGAHPLAGKACLVEFCDKEKIDDERAQREHARQAEEPEHLF